MKCKKFLLVLFIAVFSFAVVHAADDVKIAVVDMQKVFDNYEKTKNIELKLNQQMDVYKEYLAQLNQQYQNINKQFTEARDASQNILLSIAERESKRQKAQQLYESLQLKEQEVKSYADDRKAQITKLYDDMRNEVIDEIKQCVRTKAVLAGYLLVLDLSGASLNELSTVIYYQNNLDITESVIQDLNRGYRKNAADPVNAASKKDAASK